MQTANESTPGQPTAVGVAPGTTTVLLTGPTAAGNGVVGCENPARAAQQRYYLFPPGKFVDGVQRSATMIQAGPTSSATPAPAASFTRRAASAEAFTTAAATRVKRVLDPYGTIESLKGALGSVRRRRHVFHENFRVASRQEVNSALGIVLAPYGDRSPHPSFEMVAATKDFGPQAYCTRRPERGPNYRQAQTAAYEPEDRNHSINGPRLGRLAQFTCRIAGVGCPPNLGAVPTDMQLSTQYGYTPVVSQWIPMKEGAYSPAPWVPPHGRPTSNDPAFMTPWGKGAAPAYRRPGIAGPVADVATDNAGVVTPMDPATAAVHELKMHQDRMYMLGILSAGAVASTALVNVFRYAAERRDARRAKTKVAAEPAPSISGARRRRRRRR